MNDHPNARASERPRAGITRWASPFDQHHGFARLKFAIFDGLARIASFFGARLQARMNIDENSNWHDRTFVERFAIRTLGNSYAHLPGYDAHDQVRYDMLCLLIDALDRRTVLGDMIEVGVGSGATALLLRQRSPGRELYLVDTFDGFLDDDRAGERAATGQEVTSSHKSLWDFSGARRLGQLPRTTLIEKPVAEAWREIPANTTFALAHIDVDLFEPTKVALQHLAQRMQPGGYIVVHDFAAWAGARQACEEFLSTQGFAAVPMPDKSGSVVMIAPTRQADQRA